MTSIVRNSAHIEDVEATGASAHVLDIESASVDEMAELFESQDAIVWSAGAGGGNPSRTYAVDRDSAIRAIDAAEQAGTKRFVMVSYYGADVNHGVPTDSSFFAYAEAKAAADAHLRESNLAWTILGPTALTLDEPSGRISLGKSSDTTRSRALSRVAMWREPSWPRSGLRTPSERICPTAMEKLGSTKLSRRRDCVAHRRQRVEACLIQARTEGCRRRSSRAGIRVAPSRCGDLTATRTFGQLVFPPSGT